MLDIPPNIDHRENLVKLFRTDQPFSNVAYKRLKFVYNVCLRLRIEVMALQIRSQASRVLLQKSLHCQTVGTLSDRGKVLKQSI